MAKEHGTEEGWDGGHGDIRRPASARHRAPGGSDPRPAEPTASVRPQRAAPDAGVEVSASGFASHAQLEIGFGPPNSEYDVVTTARADAGGAVEVSVRVPSWARTGRSYVWVVVEVDNRPRAVTGEFTAVPRDPGPDAAGGRLSGSASSWP